MYKRQEQPCNDSQDVGVIGQQRSRTGTDGGGLSRLAITGGSAVGGAAAASALHRENAGYEATRYLKQNLCPNFFVKPGDLQTIGMERGDLIEFRRPKYQHWGVHVGDGQVVHLNNAGLVKEESLVEVANGMECRVNNLESFAKQFSLSGKSKEEVASFATNLVSPTRKIVYNVSGYNCEHFVTECMYGKAFSEQEATLRSFPLALRIAHASAKITRLE